MSADDWNVSVRKNERGLWCVYVGSSPISTHATHQAARLTAQLHQVHQAEAEAADA